MSVFSGPENPGTLGYHKARGFDSFAQSRSLQKWKNAGTQRFTGTPCELAGLFDQRNPFAEPGKAEREYRTGRPCACDRDVKGLNQSTRELRPST
jgi:hypothetical protein